MTNQKGLTAENRLSQHSSTKVVENDEIIKAAHPKIKQNDCIVKISRNDETGLSIRFVESRVESKVHLLAGILFTLCAVLVSSLIICFTAPSLPAPSCSLKFSPDILQGTKTKLDHLPLAIDHFDADPFVDIAIVNSNKLKIDILIGLGDGNFSSRPIYSIESDASPYFIISADFNKDGFVDLAVAYYDTNHVDLFLGHGDGTFTDGIRHSTGSSHPVAISVGDFNKDNHWDMAVVSEGIDNLLVYLGNGNASFDNPLVYQIGFDSSPRAIATSDFNHDDQSDIVVVDAGTNSVLVFLGNGNGTFSIHSTILTGRGSKPVSIDVADFNSDEKLDIVLANYGHDNIEIVLGKGDGTFVQYGTYSTGVQSDPMFVRVGDFDNDTHLDIAVVNSRTNNVGLFLGKGDGYFQSLQLYATKSVSPATALVIGNLNNDPWMDIVVSIDNINNIGILLGDGPKSFIPPKIYSAGGGSSPRSLASGDFNEDNILDIAIAANGRTYISILFGKTDGSFSDPVLYFTDSYMASVTVVDLNNDTHLDMIGAKDGNYGIYLFLGYGNGSFSLKTFATGNSGQFLVVDDFNNDTRLDIVFTINDIGTMKVWLGNGDGTFSEHSSYLLLDVAVSLAAVDLNNDNQLDLIVPKFGSSTISIFLGNGDGTFNLHMEYFLGIESNPRSVDIGDINEDNRLDLVVANFGTNDVLIFFGNGDGTFDKQLLHRNPLGRYSRSALARDVNGDRHLDIIVANIYEDTVGLFLGFGNGTFSNITTYSTGTKSEPGILHVADFNRDGRLDIGVILFNHHSVALLFGYFNSPYSTMIASSSSTDFPLLTFASADFDHDNQLDVVVVLREQTNIEVRLGFDNGQFNSRALYPIDDGSVPLSVTTGDFNSDNQMDIAVVHRNRDNIGIFEGLGNGKFRKETFYSMVADSHPQFITTADMNNDSRLDIITADYTDDAISILLFYDKGAFEERYDYLRSNDARSYICLLTDFNGDHHLDLVIVNYYADNFAVHFGDGDGTFSNETVYPIGSGAQARSMVHGDFNRDGYLDIAIGDYGNEQIRIYWGSNSSTFSAGETYKTLGGTYSIAVGDFNGDNRLDIAAVYQSINIMGIFLGAENGRFSEEITYTTGQRPYFVLAADLNNDRNVDAIVVNTNDNAIGVFLGFGDGSFASQRVSTTGSYSVPIAAAIGSMNDDDRLDVVVANYGSNDIAILLGNGDGTFARPLKYSTKAGSAPRSINIADFNRDKHNDIVFTTALSSEIGVMLSFGDGTFSNPMMFATQPLSYPASTAVADLNNDGWMDIVVAHRNSDLVGIYFGSSEKMFAAPSRYPMVSGSGPTSIAIGDFNQDHNQDLVVTNSISGVIAIFLGNGVGGLHNHTTYSTGVGSYPIAVATADFDQDNFLDIVVANRDTSNIIVWYGTGDGTFWHSRIYSSGIQAIPVAVVVFDLNNDGSMDFIVSNYNAGNLVAFFGSQNGSFDEQSVFSTGYASNPSSLSVGSFAADGSLSVAVATHGTNQIHALLEQCHQFVVS